VTPRKDLARPHLRGIPPEIYVLSSALIGEMNAYLNAADCAFMLREHTDTNAAASPTKFAEYCLTGLSVIMTDAVPDSFELAQRFGNLVRYDGASIGPIPKLDRMQTMCRYREVLTRECFHAAYRRLYANCKSGREKSRWL